MQKIHSSIILFLFLSLMYCCKTKTEELDEDRVGFQIESSEIPGVQKMQSYRSELPVSFKGKEYKVLVVREASDSLTKVKNNQGITYLDNKVILDIKETSGKGILHKVFTKQNFSSVVESSFLSRSILEGLVFEKTTAQDFVFAASVSYPQTDLYIPISVTVSLDGKILMKKEELLEEPFVED